FVAIVGERRIGEKRENRLPNASALARCPLFGFGVVPLAAQNAHRLLKERECGVEVEERRAAPSRTQGEDTMPRGANEPESHVAITFREPIRGRIECLRHARSFQKSPKPPRTLPRPSNSSSASRSSVETA